MTKGQKHKRTVNLRTHDSAILEFTAWGSVFGLGPDEQKLIGAIVDLLDGYDAETRRREKTAEDAAKGQQV